MFCIFAALRHPLRNYSSLIWLIFGLVAALLFAVGLSRPIDHDEAQFIASGKVLAQHNWHPILDYVYYHQPFYSYVYAFLFQITSSPLLLTVRVFCAISTVLTLRLLVKHYQHVLKKAVYNHWDKVAFPIALLVSLSMTTGLSKGLTTWNHAFPTFLLVASYLILLRNHRHYIPHRIVLAGMFFALAVAMRASLAPMVLPLFLSILFYDLAIGKKLRLAGSFIVGCLIGSLPVFVFMVLDFDAFYFNIVQFHTDFDEAYLIHEGRAKSFPGRLRLARQFMLETNNLNFVLVAVAAAVAFLFAKVADKARENRFRLWFALAMFLMSVLSALTKNVTFSQYYYLPLLLLAVLTIELYPFIKKGPRKLVVLTALVLATILVMDGSSSYKRFVRAVENDAPFYVFQVTNEGNFIHQQAGDGSVLTLAPIFVLEGGNHIYPEFVTSPFAFRTRDFVPEEYRNKYQVIGAADLDTYMSDKDPCAVYTGWERHVDDPLTEWAAKNGFTPVETPLGKQLWLKP